jgi:hypothetical protein
MSFIEESNLNYLTQVEQFFLSLKDSGLSLSAIDYHLISDWEDRGIPVETLCLAIEKGTLQFYKSSRFGRISLSYLKEFIEEEIGSR